LQRAGYRKETQKVSAEGERSNVLYCMYNTLQSGQVAKEKMHRVSAQNKQAVANFFAAKVRISTSESGLKYVCGQRSKMAFQV
jgi:hypothetical protein